MHDLIAGAAVLPVLIAIIANARAASGCRRLPRLYGGGVDIADWPTADRWRQP